MARFVALEEHYASRANFATNPGHDFYQVSYRDALDKLTSFGAGRLEDMDASSTKIQVVSYTPLHLSGAEASIANEELRKGVESNPARFAAFAALSLSDIPAATRELERCVKRFGFVGTLIPNHLDGEFYDDERFWPLFAKAEELDVPVYLHPTFPSEKMKEIQYRGNFSERASHQLGMFGLGWHSQVALHLLRLFASGLFDRFPKLQVIVGHMGEMLPFQLDRILRFADTWGSYRRGLREVWDNNIWITTAGMFSLAPMACLLRTTKVERIMYSLDFPFAPAHLGRQFMEELRGSGLVNEEELALIGYKNACQLLGLKID
ncbi:uncharacterized protein Z520_02928 [Fonsecaea multimorphosa CBS 102226]|uniref:Amidohydrolase-related domain-containing protein n=1 Tax=Fonsecaea multimorphosa CBS 102226 TaxID=1442371 RepID=A0A0D2HHK1_9EURO|nr:uncharacterized protein Z520_02928 [Fonsecaea multimorphosa CBS 102226]KIY01376.1 hypothetical protein Z520_02928 [Fonsecaea multimorphosa CBS 102226]OAL28393.1 hypothetical protein AYO22_02847 [Fonsecaea multimorphosa]